MTKENMILDYALRQKKKLKLDALKLASALINCELLVSESEALSKACLKEL